MTKRLQSIINKLYPGIFIVLILVIWQGLISFGIVPEFMLPSPISVVKAFVSEFNLLMSHMGYTLIEAFWGLSIGIAIAFVLAVLMDSYQFLYRAIYPVLIITQTVPVIAIAPLLVLWLGYGMAPKITLIALVCFFPIAIGLLDGFRAADPDAMKLMRSMGANKIQIFQHIKLPYSITGFFAGLKISVSYSVVGAVIAEWLGGTNGLGVYMTRVRKSYAYDKMFAVIFLISIISLLLMWGVDCLKKKCTPWEK